MLLIIGLGLLTYYFIVYGVFVQKYPIDEFPALRARLGTIIYHSSDKDSVFQGSFNDPNSVTHTYCYYPKGSTQYPNKGGEYILKQVEDPLECSRDWYSSFTAQEGSWVTEKEKMWLTQQEYEADHGS